MGDREWMGKWKSERGTESISIIGKWKICRQNEYTFLLRRNRHFVNNMANSFIRFSNRASRNEIGKLINYAT